jgi:hypothetical protein
METRKEEGFWKRINANVKRIFEELKEDSVASNPKKPVDCCNPPTAPRLDREKDSSQH